MEKRVLIERWLASNPNVMPIYDEASVSSARQRVREAGSPLNLSKELVESVALIASELTHNQLSYSKQGYFAVKAVDRAGVKGLEVVAADLGPGVDQPIFSGTREVRSKSGLGAGLKSVFNLADEVEIDNRMAEGLCVVARKFESPAAPQCEVAIIGKPYPGEGISGDDAVFFQSESEFLAAVSDGLGHGPEAREASAHSIAAITQNRHLELGEILGAVHAEMSRTRGCAMSIVRYVANSRILECVSAGDIRVHLYNLRDTHFFSSTPFVMGDKNSSKRKLRVEKVAVEPGAVIVIFTDGLESRTTLKEQLAVLRQPAAAIAEYLISSHSRPNDDALVLVARIKG
jgi:anti-sigma regulatory factor (Ser/Thr protein kinase)